MSAALTLAQMSDWIARHGAAGELASDSRRIGVGDIFFAYPGAAGDGRQFIAAALAQGAAGVVFEARDFVWDPQWQVPHLACRDLKASAGTLAHAFYEQPDSAMFSAGFTGTNGKTSCALWLAQALARVGTPTAVIGTLGVALFTARQAGEFASTGYTTPDAVLLARELAALRTAGAAAVAIEVSSIGLEQGRVEGMHFDFAVFTNLTRDHLDYHADMAAYEAAKSRLFDWPGLRGAVLNLDDAMGRRLLAQVRSRQIQLFGYTLHDAATQPELEGVCLLRASQIRTRPGGAAFYVECAFGAAQIKTALVGHFNISNALAVLALLLGQGIDWRSAVEAIEALTPAPGRMQQVGGQDAPMVVIDYAHTPDALEKTLLALRQVAQERGGQLWCVFGCGGERDAGKRGTMGALAQLADHVIVTSDNPRGEAAQAIIEHIVAGMRQPHPASALYIMADRATAILSAIRHAAKSDVILLAGKGHEAYQEINGKRLPFSDLEHAQLALAALTMMRSN